MEFDAYLLHVLHLLCELLSEDAREPATSASTATATIVAWRGPRGGGGGGSRRGLSHYNSRCVAESGVCVCLYTLLSHLCVCVCVCECACVCVCVCVCMGRWVGGGGELSAAEGRVRALRVDAWRVWCAHARGYG